MSNSKHNAAVSKGWMSYLSRMKNRLKTRVYPLPLSSSVAAVGIYSGLHYSSIGLASKISAEIMTVIPSHWQEGWQKTGYELVICTLLGLSSWLVLAFLIRRSLKGLLMYKGWMYEEGGRGRRVSMPTKMWLIALKVLTAGQRPTLFSYQGILPRLPVPPLRDTVFRYLKSIRPLVDDERYTFLKNLGSDFEKGIGRKLQRYLILKSWWADNYVSDWWEEYVYLHGRSPLIINSNYYCIDTMLLDPTHLQSARAALAIYYFLEFRKLIYEENMKPIRLQGVIPLCAWQYGRVFNTTRIPGEVADKILRLDDTDHIVIYHRGRYFKVRVIYQGRILQPCEIEQQIINILENNSPPIPGEEKLAALTAGNRTQWSKTRKSFFSSGSNKVSLDTIEKAAFFVSLDDDPLEYDKNDPSKLDNFACSLFHGNGCNRWFDKSFTLCVGCNGHMGFNAEHTSADGAILAHIWEYVLQEEILTVQRNTCYKEDGHTKGTPELTPPTPERLNWELNGECIKAIDTSYQVARELIDNIDLRLLVHDAYGKGFIKKCSVSPDAYIQMAIQLAYYKDTGRFTLTYEASMTRLYLNGRTETVRSCTAESTAWVKCMMDANSSVTEKITLLKKACAVHTNGYKDAMCGKGIDRHLFCLYIVSKYLGTESPFLKEALGEPWRLSTSQTPHSQMAGIDLKKNPDAITPAGGFGPTDADGYGVSYIIAGENVIYFHVSSWHSSSVTNSKRLVSNIETSLQDMKNLFLEWNILQKGH